jgi:predicted O-methyltransferase YrrM
MKVFEFGSGHSTLWFAERVQHIMSIESDKSFYDFMHEKIASRNNISYELKEENVNYHQTILALKDEFDVVIIDGKERVACAKNCLSALTEQGIIIFDNSDRTEYSEAYAYLGEKGFKKIAFRGPGPLVLSDWQTTIYYRDNNCLGL